MQNKNNPIKVIMDVKCPECGETFNMCLHHYSAVLAWCSTAKQVKKVQDDTIKEIKKLKLDESLENIYVNYVENTPISYNESASIIKILKEKQNDIIKEDKIS